ncbi:MAG: TolB family protein [bacterium]
MGKQIIIPCLRAVYCYNMVGYAIVLIIFISGLHCSKSYHAEPPEPDSAILSAWNPLWKPDGSQILFIYAPLQKIDDTTYHPINDSGGLWFIKPDGSGLLMFLHAYNFPIPTDWHPNGHKVICEGAIELNLDDTSFTPIGNQGAGVARYNVLGDKIAFFSGLDSFPQTLGIWIMDANGTNSHPTKVKDVYYYFDWSPDGKKFVFPDFDGGLSIADTNGNNRRQLAPGAGTRWLPSFSPDGKKIAFEMRKTPGDDYAIFVINVDGSNLKKLDVGRYPSWSPDGTKIAYVKYSYYGKYEDGNGQLWVMRADGSNKKQLTFIRE